jgi:hypothetical protein
VSRRRISFRHLVALVFVALIAGTIAARADTPKRPVEPVAVPQVAPAVPLVRLLASRVPCARPTRPPAANTPPSKALLDAFAVLRRERKPEDALSAEALAALQRARLAPVSPDSARLVRSTPSGGRAWVVPVPDVRGPLALACVPGNRQPSGEGLAVVATGAAAAGGGGSLADLVRDRAPVSVDSCAGEKHDLLSVSGIVPDGVAAAFLTSPDGTAVRADVKDNGYEFLVPRSKTIEPRYVVWTGGDGTPHVQPVTASIALPAGVCGRIAGAQRAPRVTPSPFAAVCPAQAIVPPVLPPRRGVRPVLVPPRALFECAPPAVAVAPAPVPIRPKRHR